MARRAPSPKAVTISPSLLSRLIELDNVVGIKDSSNDLTLFQKYVSVAEEKIAVVIGMDTLILPALILNAKGSINAIGNIAPKLLVDLYNAVKTGNYTKARMLQEKVFFIRNALSVGTFPAAVKEAVNLIGGLVDTLENQFRF